MLQAMGQFILSLGALLVANVSLLGWGGVVRRAAGSAGGTWPVTISLGLSAALLLGGIVNLARITFAPTLCIIAAAGIVFFVPYAATWNWPATIQTWWKATPKSQRVEAVFIIGFVAVVIGIAIATQLPPAVFSGNDLQTYFAHPTRELQTGTLFGSPVNSLGSISLGGIAFLQSFVLSLFPIQFINGVDAVFGLALLMTLVAFAGWRPRDRVKNPAGRPVKYARACPQDLPCNEYPHQPPLSSSMYA
jgi:hypothetical protein